MEDEVYPFTASGWKPVDISICREFYEYAREEDILPALDSDPSLCEPFVEDSTPGTSAHHVVTILMKPSFMVGINFDILCEFQTLYENGDSFGGVIKP